MKLISKVMAGVGIAAAAAILVPSAAMAQDSSYKMGTVWEASDIKVMPGQFENYMDYLAKTWKKVQELAKAEGILVEYHVLATNHARRGEPDLILVVEYKDYATIAQREAFSKKLNALLAQDDRKADTASGERTAMRELLGSAEFQELVLK